MRITCGEHTIDVLYVVVLGQVTGKAAMPRKGVIMRILTKEYLEKLKRSEAYQMIVNTPPPDLTKARKDAEIFARWIAREHRKERLAMESRGA
jgi:hypothetical protein